MKEWMDKQSDRINKEKDTMLKKYLRSRQDNERELAHATERMHQRRRVR